MKYFLAIFVSLFLLGCAGSQTQNNETARSNSSNFKNVITDEEFDVLIAPEYDYESDVPYAEQIKVTTKTTSVSTSKPAKSYTKPAAVKVK